MSKNVIKNLVHNLYANVQSVFHIFISNMWASTHSIKVANHMRAFLKFSIHVKRSIKYEVLDEPGFKSPKISQKSLTEE